MARADLKKFGQTVLADVREGVKSSAGLVEDRLKANVGLTDHSLKDLERLGHPYSVKNPRQLHDPQELVHRQSDALYNSISVRREGADGYAIGADETITNPRNGEQYVIDVIEGTSKMVARNFPKLTMDELESQKTLVDNIEKAIKGALDKF